MSSHLPLNEIVGELCHDINNPLAIVCGTSHQLGRLVEEEKFDPLKAKAYLERMDRNLERITKLVKGMAVFARKTTAEATTKFDVQKLADLVGPFCEELLKKGKVDFTLTLQPELRLNCRLVGVAQAILILIRHTNALTQTLPVKKVGLAIQGVSKNCLITVTRPNQEKPSATSLAKDLQQDLASIPEFSYVREICATHGGSFSCTSKDGQLELTMSLPVVDLD